MTMKKTKQLRKAVVAVLVSIMGMTTLAGCAGSSNSTTKEPEVTPTAPAVKVETEAEKTEVSLDKRKICEGVTLTIAVPENVRIIDWETNDQTLEIEEALGVDLKFKTFPAADYDSKLNLMVMGGDKLPDIIINPGDSVYSWAQEGAIIGLKKYYDDPNMSATIRQASEANDIDIVSYLTQPDGEVYCLPAWTGSPNANVWRKAWINQVWVEQLGMEMPKTTDELYEVLKKVSSTDMNGNGKQDEIGMTGYKVTGDWFRFLMSSFIYAHDSNFIVVDDGKLSFAYDTEEWREGLRFIKKLFDEGIIPIETLTQDASQHKAMLNSEDQTVFMFTGWNPNNISLVDRKLSYMYMNALEGPNGVKEAMYMPNLPNKGAAITADCENPDAAFLVLDYMCSETFSISIRYGKQGVNWDYWEDAKVDNKSEWTATTPGEEIYLIVYDDASFWGGSDAQNACYMQAGPQIVPANVVTGMAINNASTDEEENKAAQVAARYAESTQAGLAIARKEVADYMPLTSEETEEVSGITAPLTTYVEESIGAFLTGTKSLDGDWDSYLNELDKIGYKDALSVYQEAYDRVH